MSFPKRTHLLGFSLLLSVIVLDACKKRTFSDPKAINIQTDKGTNRIYMAFDPESPERVAWFLCKDEPQSTDTLIPSPTEKQLRNVLWAGRMLRGRPQPSQFSDATLTPEGFSDAKEDPRSPSKRLEGGYGRASIFLDERMTLTEFEDSTSGKGCEQLIGPGSAATVKEQAKKALDPENSGDLTQPLFSAVASCAGLTKEGLVMASVLTSTKRETVRSILGFQGAKITRQNAGGVLVGIFGSVVFCTFGAKGLFQKMSEMQEASAVSDKMFLSYFDTVVATADALFSTQAQDKKIPVDVAEKINSLPKEVKDKIEEDKVRFQELITQGKQREAAQIFMPYVVGSWNFVNSKDVDATSDNGKTLLSATQQFLGNLARRLGKR
jgi:hypothetical protein